MSILVIGFCDCWPKLHGSGDIVFFAAHDQFAATEVPSSKAVLKYARELGYYPSGKPGAIEGKCDPVYCYVSDPVTIGFEV